MVLRAHSLAMVIRGIYASGLDTISSHDYRDKEQAMNNLLADARQYFEELKKSNDFQCDFYTGEKPVLVHALRPLGTGEHALFERGFLSTPKFMTLDYCEVHNTPQDCPQDLPHYSAESRQLYIGSTKNSLALSVNQMGFALFHGGYWQLRKKA